MKFYQRSISNKIEDTFSIIAVSSLERKTSSGPELSFVKNYMRIFLGKYQKDARTYFTSDIHNNVSCMFKFGFLKYSGSLIK